MLATVSRTRDGNRGDPLVQHSARMLSDDGGFVTNCEPFGFDDSSTAVFVNSRNDQDTKITNGAPHMKATESTVNSQSDSVQR